MIAIRVFVGVLALAGISAVVGSVLRTIVLPRAASALLPRATFLSVRELLLLRLRLTGRSDYRTRDRVFAWQAPLGVFAQLFAWALLLFLGFAALFWSVSASRVDGRSVARALEQSGSSMLTLGFDTPSGLGRQLLAFAAAGVGLTLFALIIAYLPTLYGAFSRREALPTQLAVQTGVPPSGAALLSSTWRLGRLDQLSEVWEAWEGWFIDVGQSHTTFPQLAFFRCPEPQNHWVLASEAVLDGIALFTTVCDLPRQSRSELCLDAGVHALTAIADFYPVLRRSLEADAQITLPEEKFDRARRELEHVGVPVRKDRSRSWSDFRRMRARYEPQLTVLGGITDAPRSEWSPWPDVMPPHVSPLSRASRG